MKKIITSLVVLMTMIPLFAAAQLNSNLSYGLQKNSDVKQLQQFLIDKGFLTGSATGNFFSLTLTAVKKYQASVGINQTGYVGILTKKSINAELASKLSSSTQGTSNDTGNSSSANGSKSTTNNTESSLQAKINALQQQIALLQQPQNQATQNFTPSTTTNPITICTPNWQCGNWGNCLNANQTRTCNDLNSCNTYNQQPALTQYCSTPITQPNPTPIPTPTPASVPQATINILETVYNATSTLNLSLVNKDITARKGFDFVVFAVKTFDAQGKQIDSLPITVTTNNPDLPPTFNIVTNQGFYVGKHSGNPQSDCSNDNHDCLPQSIGTFTLTFSQPDLNVSKTVSLTVVDFTYQKVVLTNSISNIPLAGDYNYPNSPVIGTINVSGVDKPLTFLTANYDIISNDFTKGKDIGTLWFYIGNLYTGRELSPVEKQGMIIQPNQSKNIDIKVGQDGFFTHGGTFSVHLTNLVFAEKNIPVDITIPNISVQ